MSYAGFTLVPREDRCEVVKCRSISESLQVAGSARDFQDGLLPESRQRKPRPKGSDVMVFPVVITSNIK